MKILLSRRSLAVVAGMKKLNDHAEPTKVEPQKNKFKKIRIHLKVMEKSLSEFAKRIDKKQHSIHY